MTLDLRITSENASGQLTETDPNNRLAASSATTLDITALARNEVASRCFDGGSAGFYSGRAYAEGELYLNASGISGYICLGFSSRDSSASLATVSGEAAELFLAPRSDVADINFYDILYESGVDHSGAGVSSGTRPQKLTRVYYRIGFYSSIGGEFGALCFEFYSDITRATLIRKYLVTRQAAGTYRYYHVAQSYSSGSAINVTGDTANVTIYQPAAGIDLTVATGGFTQTDPSAHITDYADCIVCTTLNTNEDAYHYKDYGASYFNGNYILQGVLNVTAFATGSGTMLTLLSLMNTVNDGNNTDDKQCIALDYVSATTYTLKVREVSSATGYNSSASSTLNTNQPYWLKSWRDTSVGTYGTLYLAIYNDPTMLSQVGTTLSLALHDNGTPDVAAFQYFYPLQSWNTASSRTTTFTIGGISVQNQVYNATKGAFSWAGKTSTISEQATAINATVGAFSWAGKSSPLSQMIQATKGAFSWAGKTVNLNTGGQVNTSPGAFSWGGKSSPLSRSIVTLKGAFSWAGKTSLLGSTVTSLRTATLTKWDTATQKEIPDTGLTGVLYMLYDPINLKVYDFSDNTFKASASCVTPQGTMTERVLLNSVGTNLTPGVYDILLATTGLSGLYQEYLFYYGTTNHLDSNPVRFQDGIEYLGGLTVLENSNLSTVVTQTDSLEASVAALPTTVASATLAAALLTPIASDVQKVNAITVTGSGTAADPWNPP